MLLARLVKNPDAVPPEYRRPPADGRGRYMLHRAVVRHTAGAVSRLVPGDEIHRMHNPRARDTLEIHVYGKDLVGLARKTWADDGAERPLVSGKYLNC